MVQLVGLEDGKKGIVFIGQVSCTKIKKKPQNFEALT